jgi:hypothetical protein
MANPSTGGTGSRRCSGTDLGACRADDAHQEARVSSIATRTFWPGRALGIQARTHVGLRSQQRFGSGRGGGDIGSWLAGTRLGWVAKPARAASSDIGWLNDACWLRLRGLSSMNGLVPQSLPTEQRKVAGSIPAPPILINAVNSPVYDLDWPVPVETDNRSRCVRSLVRCGAHLGLEMSVSSVLVVRSCARHQRRRQLRSVSPYWASRNPSTVERWGCGECAVGAAGCEARGSGSMCRWRRSAVVRIPAFRAGHREGRNAATPGRNGIRNTVSGATRRRPRRRAGGGGNVASSMVPNDRVGSNCRGVVSSRARWGATAWVDPGLSLQVGRSRSDKSDDYTRRSSRRLTRCRWDGGVPDWRSAAVVGIVAWPVLGQ